MPIDLPKRVDELLAAGSFDLPLPGCGTTTVRHDRLTQWGCEDLSLARIAEAHTDAVAILRETECEPRAQSIYGVWASDGPRSRLTATPAAGGGWRLDGLKQYCSGASLIDAALVTAHDDGRLLLFDISLDTQGVTLCPSTWAATAFSDTATIPVAFQDVSVPATAVIGSPGWYLTRPGFWHGAIGPAACWAGGAMSLIDAAGTLNRQDAHSRAQLGALQSIRWGLEAVLARAGREIDADPLDLEGGARGRALKVRHLIERWCTEVLDRFGRATGPQLLAFDECVARQYAALSLYIRQCHGERDLEAIPG